MSSPHFGTGVFKHSDSCARLASACTARGRQGCARLTSWPSSIASLSPEATRYQTRRPFSQAALQPMRMEVCRSTRRAWSSFDTTTTPAMTSIVHRHRTPSRTSRTARGRVFRPKGGSSISPASRVTCATPPRSFAARVHRLLCKGACTTSRATRTSPSALFTVGLRSCKHRSSFPLRYAASSHLIIRTASVASRDMSGLSSWRHRCGIPTQMLPRLGAHRRARPPAARSRRKF